MPVRLAHLGSQRSHAVEHAGVLLKESAQTGRIVGKQACQSLRREGAVRDHEVEVVLNGIRVMSVLQIVQQSGIIDTLHARSAEYALDYRSEIGISSQPAQLWNIGRLERAFDQAPGSGVANGRIEPSQPGCIVVQ